VTKTWARFYDAAGDDPRETLLAALERFDAEPREGAKLFGVDLGCGTGRDTAELLRRGWRVLAIDSQADAVERLLGRGDVDGTAAGRLETKVASFEDAVWPDADLVNSSFALPFCPPQHFGPVWARIVASLRPGGRFCGQLFGDRDEWASGPAAASFQDWASPPAMSFHTSEEIQGLLRGFDVEQLDEVDQDGTTALGDPKHWHLFHIVARKH
jgi:SAM-dependent methyltransferase